MRPGQLTLSWIVAALLLGVPTSGATGCARNVQDGQNRSRIVRTQTGYASFYGPGFEGEETASGRRFDPEAMVAAHRTIPLGTRVRVTNLENGRSVILRIIDRGPYVGRNTIIDVSEGAARQLRFIRDGRVRVRVDVLSER
jgi:rare lipoprotein A